LKGVVLHYGTADFGHYFSYIKETDSLWLEFNDERVREIDPRDIETDCFGGEGWRRESQSAYLCVYEKVKKRPITLEFDTEEQRDTVLAQFNLKKAII
jgi:ubiquitin carboxyl-terminal hydrolase 34